MITLSQDTNSEELPCDILGSVPSNQFVVVSFFCGEKMIIYYEDLKNTMRFYNKNKIVEIEKGKKLVEFLRRLYFKKIKLKELIDDEKKRCRSYIK